jgi:DNA polymerase-3 subunit alpha
MATVLSLNKDNIKDVNFFLSETKRMGIKTLVPDINESKSLFTVNKNGDIRFGLAGIKGVGGAAIDEIVLEREKNGIFNTFFDFTKRVNLRSINKRNLEAMAYAGAFDGFPNVHRAQFFHEGKEGNLVEKGIRYGNYFKEKAMNSMANLFGGSADENIQEPDLPVCDEWGVFKQLQLEKEYTGIYVSGHPLDDYAFEINKFGFGSINELTELKGKNLKIPVLISSVSTRMDAKNRTFAIVNIEDLEGSMEVRFFSDDYVKFGNYLKQGALLMLHGIYNNSKWNEDRYDFRVNEILHLGDLLDKKTKSLEVGLNFEDLDLELVIALEQTLKKYPGKKLCTLELTYFGEKETINFNSRSVLLDICKPLINELEQIPGVRVKIK